MAWFLYIVECSDQSLYAGITTDVPRRIQEHNESPKGAKYTKSRRPVTLRVAWEYLDRSQASKAEIAFKKCRLEQKKRLIANNTPPSIKKA